MAVGLFYIHDILDTFVFHPRSRATLVSRPEVSRCSRDTFGTSTAFQTWHVFYKSSRRGHNPLSREGSAIVTRYSPRCRCRKARTELAKYSSSECEREYIKFVLTQIISRGSAFRDLVEKKLAALRALLLLLLPFSPFSFALSRSTGTALFPR